MFRPNVKDIKKAIEAKHVETTSESIKNAIYDLYQPYRIEREGLSSEPELVVSSISKYLEEWRWDIQLFLYGYVINEICKQIGRLGKRIKPEKEIWITSFWDIQISRVVL